MQIVKVYFDGSCHNTGNKSNVLGAGVVAFLAGTPIEEGSYCGSYLGTVTDAEWYALEKAVELATQLHKDNPNVLFTFLGDNQSVVYSIMGKYKVRGRFIEVYNRVLKLLDSLPLYNFKWIPREHNTYADDLSKHGREKFYKSR